MHFATLPDTSAHFQAQLFFISGKQLPFYPYIDVLEAHFRLILQKFQHDFIHSRKKIIRQNGIRRRGTDPKIKNTTSPAAANRI
jgi:hypothetical protein